MGRIAKKISLKMLIVLAIMILIPVSVYAKPSSDNVGSDKWFSSGGLDLKINQFKNGKKVTYTSGHIDISRSLAPDWDDAKDNSFEWDLKLTNSDGKLSLKETKANSKKRVAFSDPYYMHEADYSWAGYYGFQIDFDMKMPKGYRYEVDSLKADTLNVDANGANRRAMMIYFPKASYETFSDKDEMRKNTLVIHGTNMGIMTLNETIYTNNAIELTLEPNETNISYDANGGSGKIADQKVTYEKKAKIQENVFRRTGYTFNGWNTKKDGSGKSYSVNQDVTTAFPSQKSVTLYAQWKEIKVQSITLDKTKIVGEKSKSGSLTATLKPSGAKNKTVSYSSSSSKVVSVGSDGKLKFADNGYAEITAKSANGLSAKCKVTVYSKIEDNISDIKGYTREAVSLFDHAYEKSSIMRGMVKNEALSILGESDRYYYIRADKDKACGFVLKSKIEIPLVDLRINNGDFAMEKGMKKQLTAKLIPAITTQRKVTWESSDKSVATVSSTGQVHGEKEGYAMISALGVKQPAKPSSSSKKSKEIILVKSEYVTAQINGHSRKWIKTGEVQRQGVANTIQGIGGIGKKMYYVKIKKVNGVEKYVALYKAKITSYKTTVKGKRVKRQRITGDKKIGNLKGKCHYNGIAVQNYIKKEKKDGKIIEVEYTDIFHTITYNTKGKIGKCILLNDKIKKKNVDIPCVGKFVYKKGGKQYDIKNRCFYSITRVGKQFILKSGDYHFICEPSADREKMVLKNAFKAAGKLEYKGKLTTTQGSASFAFSDGKYYYVCHTFHMKKVKSNKKFFTELCNRSYVFRYRLDNTGDGRIKPTKQYVYKFIGDARRVPWRSSAKRKYKRQKRYFEIEGVYIYKKVAFFLTEGSTYCVDIKGRFSPK